ncbi:hypothetical protein [Corallibacter sp.]|uniref:hypothetical protein n=1 Tax=Corallibacter sp. TaxID=2038084 RepID=UPI003AB6AAD8
MAAFFSALVSKRGCFFKPVCISFKTNEAINVNVLKLIEIESKNKDKVNIKKEKSFFETASLINKTASLNILILN